MRRLLRSLPVPLLAVSMGFAAFAFQDPAGAVQTADAGEIEQYAALIGDYPKLGSDGSKADFAILLWLQRSRTADDVRRALSEVNVHLGLFSEVTGRDLESPAFPLTRALAADLQKDLGHVTSALKTRFGRPRPYVANALVKPAIKLEANLAYPSGHSSWGTAQAALLAELLPGRREAILARGRQIGYDRVIGGVHHPSDVVAGQVLGPVFAQAWLAVPAHRQRLEQARAEW